LWSGTGLVQLSVNVLEFGDRLLTAVGVTLGPDGSRAAAPFEILELLEERIPAREKG
jgi:hypothetical protein